MSSSIHTLMAAGDASGSILNSAANACKGACNTGTSVQGLMATASNVLIYLVGSISVIMIIVGGLRYTTSGGDPKATGAAKATIMYAVIGVIVALVAFAIVKFVVNAVPNR